MGRDAAFGLTFKTVADMPCVSDTGATAPISALTYAFSIDLDRGHKTDDFGPGIIAKAVRETSTWTAYGARPDLKRTGTGPQEDWRDLEAGHVRLETGLSPHRIWTTSGPMHAPSVPPDDSFAEIIAPCTTSGDQTGCTT
jgi:hypothetical protein